MTDSERQWFEGTKTTVNQMLVKSQNQVTRNPSRNFFDTVSQLLYKDIIILQIVTGDKLKILFNQIPL
mgnify:CR=1 FL=1